ncbi:Mov34/MPN/PAD-1 family protein [Maribacter sp. SA7]|uniref:Mov34/MPN/PAD-1 family protein n=1 Tax=Maribacter zhoushanensis TaxID=3030012 RepID=UPI0023ECC130|nr:Mov34/MPN/PAD-1 family protein [Maribacter zhoushanensis]MDF4203106.1 Mov34/MPN/PAD-1 family protein [Maribacter zhoushanensis]
MCKAIRFKLPGNGILQINGDVIKELSMFKQIESESTEAGGVILGRILKETNHLIIDEITTPFKSDIRKRFYFKRRKESHQKIVDKRWKESDKTENYFGEWHTHAEDNPTPSYVDKDDWKRRVKRDKLFLDFLVSIIVGRESIEVWLTDENEKIIKLKKANV